MAKITIEIDAAEMLSMILYQTRELERAVEQLRDVEAGRPHSIQSIPRMDETVERLQYLVSNLNISNEGRYR